ATFCTPGRWATERTTAGCDQKGDRPAAYAPAYRPARTEVPLRRRPALYPWSTRPWGLYARAEYRSGETAPTQAVPDTVRQPTAYRPSRTDLPLRRRSALFPLSTRP